MSKPSNIFPTSDTLLGRSAREEQLQQRAKVIWFTGLSGSGKTTIARQVEFALHGQGVLTYMLDGDNVRAGINNNLGFSEEDRSENIRRIAEVSKLFVQTGVVCINCFVSPTHAIRAKAKEIIGEEDFLEIFVDTPLAVCEARDVKGLYAKARRGEIPNFTGVSAPYEAPNQPDLVLQTEGKSVEDNVEETLQMVLPHIRYEQR